MIPLAWGTVGLVGLAATIGAFNLATWPRGREVGATDRRISVLVPARNEERGIGACVDAILAQRHPVFELVVYDDGSTDGTPAILAERRADPRLRVERGIPLPEGWVGKPHACHQLSRLARGDLWIFVDADVVLDPDAVGRIVGLLDRWGAGVLTAVPAQETGTWMEKLVLPLLHLTYIAWLPLLTIPLTQDTRFLAANGQILAVSREAHDRLGGFSAVRTEVVDDMAFCRAAKRAGLRVLFADGTRLGRCRMYTSARGVWQGFSKNLYEGLGESPWMLLVVLALYIGAFVLPYALLALAPVWAGLWLPAITGVALNLLLRVAMAVRYRQNWLGVFLHPVAVLVLMGIALNSWRWARRGSIVWAGRTYAPRSARGAP
jgi:chlorobactene glucosyltransferase